MDIKNLTLTPGQALVLVGPQGCGKTLIARQIAQIHGSYLDDVDASELLTRRGIDRILAVQANTVIVEGMPDLRDRINQSRIKALLSDKEAVISPPHGSRPILVKTPNFIFCTGDADYLTELGDGRRFFVVDLGKKQ